MKQIWRNKKGMIRAIWPFASAFLGWGAATVGVSMLYWLIYNGCLMLWGVTAENVYRAPIAVRLWVSSAQAILTCLQGACMCAFSYFLTRVWRIEEKKGEIGDFLTGSGWGAAGMLVLWGVLLLTRLMRVDGSLIEMRFSANTLSLVHTVFWQAAGEAVFWFGLIWPLMKRYARREIAVGLTLALYVGAQALSYAPGGFSLVNAALLFGLCLVLQEKRGMAGAAGLMFGLRYLESAVLGFPGAGAALYETYPVRLYALSGGNQGIWHGAVTAMLLAGALLVVVRRNKTTKSEK